MTNDLLRDPHSQGGGTNTLTVFDQANNAQAMKAAVVTATTGADGRFSVDLTALGYVSVAHVSPMAVGDRLQIDITVFTAEAIEGIARQHPLTVLLGYRWQPVPDLAINLLVIGVPA